MRHLHLGLGRFHRAHQAFYLQRVGIPITAFSMRSPAEADALRQAGHRYQLVILGDGAEERVEMTVIDEALFLQRDRERFLELMVDPEVRTLTLTVTEKGYCAGPGGKLDLERAEGSVVNDLVDGLRHRQAVTSAPLNVLSCDNLSSNGRLLRSLCRQWSEHRDQPFDGELVSFPDSMVDRIVPAGPDPLEIRTEAFHQWVIEDRFLGGRPRWEQPGLLFVEDVEPFEKMKLSLLNASHSFLAYYGQLRGFEFVHQAIVHETIRDHVQTLCREVGAHLTIPPETSLEGYVETMLRRFDNPRMPHRLDQIAMDGSQKIPQRILPFWEESSVLKTALSAWFSYAWYSLKEGRFRFSDPRAEDMRQAMTGDFNQTARRWKEMLGWPDREVRLIEGAEKRPSQTLNPLEGH